MRADSDNPNQMNLSRLHVIVPLPEYLFARTRFVASSWAKSSGPLIDPLGLRTVDRTGHETTSPVGPLWQHDHGLTIESFEFSDNSEKPAGRELVGHDVVLPYAVETIVRRQSQSTWFSETH